MPPAATRPTILTDPGFLWIAPVGTAEPTPTVTAGKFADVIPVAWLPLGSTEEGSTFSYNSTVEPVMVAEFFDPISYYTTERSGNIAFSLANWSLSNYRRALNGGVAALVPTGVSGSEITTLEPPTPGNEARSMVLWQSTDDTVRILLRQCMQGGEVSSAFQKAPSKALIPCTFNMEIPTGGTQPWKMWAAGTTRV